MIGTCGISFNVVSGIQDTPAGIILYSPPKLLFCG
jgi:hypothetical protein